MPIDQDSIESVRLVQDRRNQFLGTFTALVGAGFFWVWFRSGQLEASAGVIFFAFLAYAAWHRLDPERCFLLLGPEGFEEHLAFGKPNKRRWNEISEFRVQADSHGTQYVAYLLIGNTDPEAIDGRIGDTYGFQPNELSTLLNRRLNRTRKQLLIEHEL